MKMTTSFMIRAMLMCLGVLGTTTFANAVDGCPNRPVLLIGNNKLILDKDEPVCVKRNGVFRIKLEAAPGYTLDTSKVTVKQTSGTIEIKDENVINGNVMKIRVGAFPINTEHKYDITVDGVGILDPRVRIDSNYPNFSLTNELIDEYLLDEYGLGLLDLQKLDQNLRELYQIDIASLLHSIQMSEAE